MRIPFPGRDWSWNLLDARRRKIDYCGLANRQRFSSSKHLVCITSFSTTRIHATPDRSILRMSETASMSQAYLSQLRHYWDSVFIGRRTFLSRSVGEADPSWCRQQKSPTTRPLATAVFRNVRRWWQPRLSTDVFEHQPRSMQPLAPQTYRLWYQHIDRLPAGFWTGQGIDNKYIWTIIKHSYIPHQHLEPTISYNHSTS